MNGKRRTPGFTLVEVLIVLAILGIILVAVMNVQVGMMRDSARVTGQANRLQELEDASNYVADRLKGASVVSTSLTVNGESCTISSTTSPCFGVLTREFRDVSGSTPVRPNAYLYLVYRLVPRSTPAEGERVTDTWADSNTLALVEYRKLACAPTGQADNLSGAVPACTTTTTPTTVPPTLAGAEMNVIMDRTTVDAVSGTFTPFAYTASTRKFEIKLRVKEREQGTVRYAPGNGPLTLIVQHRN